MNDARDKTAWARLAAGLAACAALSAAEAAAQPWAGAERQRAHAVRPAASAAGPPALDIRRTARGEAWEALMASQDAVEEADDGDAVAHVEDAAPREALARAEVPAPDGRYIVQIGAFGDPDNAARAQAAVAALGPAFIEPGPAGAGRTLHRVRLGPWAVEADARAAQARATALGFAGATVAAR